MPGRPACMNVEGQFFVDEFNKIDEAMLCMLIRADVFPVGGFMAFSAQAVCGLLQYYCITTTRAATRT